MSEEIKDIEMKADSVSEPTAGYALKGDAATDINPEADYDFGEKDFGYARSVEELELALDEADAERSNPEKWISSVEFHTRLENKYPWLK